MRSITRVSVVIAVIASLFTISSVAMAADATCGGLVPTITGTGGDDILTGTPGDDVILAKNGNDIIEAGAGNDVICGNGGADVIDAGDGDDIVYANDGADVVDAGDGDDTVFGGRGSDTIYGGFGADTISGNGSTDRIYGGPGGDTIFGGEQSDLIWGQAGDDIIYGQNGDDRIKGGGGNDIIRGQAGNDRLRGGPGDDILYPGPGDDNRLYGEDGFDRCISPVPFPDCEDNDFNDAPLPASDAFSTDEDTAIEGDLFADNGSGEDADPNDDVLTVSAVDGESASVGVAIELESGAILTVAADGTFSYDPTGALDVLDDGDTLVDGFSYTASDASESGDAEVTIEVAGLNDVPVAGDDEVSVDEDTVAEIDVLANDEDPDADAVLVVTLDTDPANGILSVDGEGLVTYTPDENYNGPDSFTYSVSDGVGTDSATVTITVAPVNDAPVALDDSTATLEDNAVTIDVLDNDSDVDGDTLSASILGAPANGDATVNESGLVDYTPDLNFTGEDTFSYTLSDGNGGTDIGIVTVNVAPVQDAPTAGDDTAETNEDDSVDIDVLRNDIDSDGDALTVSIETTPANGSVSVGEFGVVTYTPADNFNGEDSFTYTIDDGNLNTDTATVTVTVLPVNDAPVADDDASATDEDGSVVIDVLVNDSDIDGDTLAIQSFTQGEDGAVVEVEGGLQYTPAADFFGTDGFAYTVTDGNGGTDTAFVSVAVNPLPDPPVANDDDLVAFEDDDFVTGSLYDDNGFGIDFDVDGDALTITVVNGTPISGPHFETLSNGVLEVRPDGTYIFTPDAGFQFLPEGAEINDTLTYTVSDGVSTDDAAVSVTLLGQNDDPVAADDLGFGTDEETAIAITGVLDNDSDVDAGDIIELVGVDGLSAEGAALTLNVDGSITYDPAGALDRIPVSGSLVDTFEYFIADGNGGMDSGAVTVTVTGINDAPVAADDDAEVSEDATQVIVDVRLNDEDVDVGDVIDVTAINITGTVGQVTILADDTIRYRPNGLFEGLHTGETATDTFAYTIIDGNGGTDDATVTITVVGVTDNPTAGDDSATTAEDTAVTIDVLDNDDDIEGDTLAVSIDVAAEFGSTEVELDGQVTYTPNKDFNGGDSFVYLVDDGFGGTATATVLVTVTPVPDAPDAFDDDFTTPEETPFTGSVFDDNGNGVDIDVDGDTLSVIEANDAPFTVSTVVSLTIGDVTLGTDGSLSFAPALNATGTDSFTYTVSDGALTDTATVTITVGAVNDAPDAVDDEGVTTPEDTAVTVDVLANDDDVDGDTLSIESFTQPANGVVTEVLGGLQYAPAENFNGFDSFTYTITDGELTDTATVFVEVTAVNDAPDAVDDEGVTTLEDTAVMVDVLANDDDVDGDELSIESFTQPANGVVTEVLGGLEYTPDLNFNGLDSFTYTITDGELTDTATVFVAVGVTNDAPDAVDDEGVVTLEDTAVTVDVLANDDDVDGDTLSIESFTQPANGVVTEVVGGLEYTPAENFNGFDSFTYTITDGELTDTATVFVEVTAVNDAPDAVDDEGVTTLEDTAVTVDVLANDDDVDGDTLSIQSFTQPTNGAVTEVLGGLEYTPAQDFNGSDSFTYTITDGELTDTATVFVEVSPVADAPDAVDDEGVSTPEDTAVTVDVLANDDDVDGDTLSIQSFTQPTNGAVTEVLGGLEYSPAQDFNGPDSFTYTITDGALTDTATVFVTVTAVNDAPDAVDDEGVTTLEDTSVTVDVLANDDDVDGDELSIESFTQPANGVVTEVLGGLEYSPGQDFNGSDSFTYTITDGVLTDTATVFINVTPVQDPPVAGDDSGAGFRLNTGLTEFTTGSVLANDSDPDGDTLTVTNVVVTGTAGTVTYNGNGTFTYENTGLLGEGAEDSWSYRANDGNGGTDLATVTVRINTIPIAAADAPTTDEDTDFDITVLDGDVDGDDDDLVVTGVDVTGTVGAVTLNLDGTVNYDPNGQFEALGTLDSTTDSFTYSISDGFGGTDTETVTVTVTGVNDAPTANNAVIALPENDAIGADVYTVAGSDVDSPTLTYSITGGNTGSDFVINSATGLIEVANSPDFERTPTYTLSIGISDAETSITRTVTVLIGNENEAPIAGDDGGVGFTTDEDTAFTTADVRINDDDPEDDVLTVVSFDATGTIGLVSDVGNGTFTYDPNGQFEALNLGQTATDTFTYTVSDGEFTDTATVTITIEGVDDPNASILITVDNSYDVYVNGSLVGSNGDWSIPETYNVFLNQGDVVAVRGADAGGNWGFAAEVTVEGITYPTNAVDWKALNGTASEPLGWTDQAFDDSLWGAATLATNPPGLPLEFTTAQWIWEAASGVNDTVLFRFTVPFSG